MLTRVAHGVHVHQSEVLLNNTVVVEGDDGVLLVDPGVSDSELGCLATDLTGLGHRAEAGFATHPDWDHVLWHPALGEAVRYGTARCAEFMSDLRGKPDWRAIVTEGLPPEVADDMTLDLFGQITTLPAGAGEVPWSGSRIRVLEHPAHAIGHAALLVEQVGVLIAGDMLSDLFVPMLDDFREDNDPLAEYLAGLGVLESVAGEVETVIPGHGSPCDATGFRSRLEQDRAYVVALRSGEAVDDPRIGAGVPPGWEWVRYIHEGQVDSVAAWRGLSG